jgi:hypothetical protein
MARLNEAALFAILALAVQLVSGRIMYDTSQDWHSGVLGQGKPGTCIGDLQSRSAGPKAVHCSDPASHEDTSVTAVFYPTASRAGKGGCMFPKKADPKTPAPVCPPPRRPVSRAQAIPMVGHAAHQHME